MIKKKKEGKKVNKYISEINFVNQESSINKFSGDDVAHTVSTRKMC